MRGLSLTDSARVIVRIGPLLLDNNLVVAPMAGVTDRPFRALCRRLGAGLAVSEMISADTSLWESRKSLRRMDHAGEPEPVSVQIVGSEPGRLADAARANVDRGARIIDVNMGCPARKVCRVAAGSALLRDEPLVGRILETVARSVDVPVTVKIRTGWEPENRNGVRVARIAESAGVAAIAVHGRTRACGFAGHAEYETIRAIKDAVGIPVIANGDIDTPEKAADVLALTGADGIMVGRGAQGRPWLFRDIGHFLATGERLPPPSPEWVQDLVLEHLEALYAFYGEARGVRVARKHLAWYARGERGAAAFRERVNRAETAQLQRRLVGALFDAKTGREEVLAA
jgi:tRNA-dihydrouridine synthase B